MHSICINRSVLITELLKFNHFSSMKSIETFLFCIIKWLAMAQCILLQMQLRNIHNSTVLQQWHRAFMCIIIAINLINPSVLSHCIYQFCPYSSIPISMASQLSRQLQVWLSSKCKLLAQLASQPLNIFIRATGSVVPRCQLTLGDKFNYKM